MAILKHCKECNKLIHPSLPRYCSVECEELYEVATLMKHEAAMDVYRGAWNANPDDVTTFTIEVQTPPIKFILFDMEVSI